MADEPKAEAPPPPAGKPESAPPEQPVAPKAEAKPAPKPPPAAGGHAPPKAAAPMAATPWEGELPAMLKERFGEDITELSTYLGQSFLIVKPSAAIPVLDFLKLEADFDYLVDLTAVDYPKRADRFDVVYILYSFARNERIRVKTLIPDGFKLETSVGVHLCANWMEREVFDMFGIQFAGHPDMRRILLPEEWEGFPLRKEYGLTQQDDRWVKENLGIESGQ
ncbi:MAG: NADH-quinone oxidoreductase subunit C [Bryobacteraceae bacterium]